MDERDILNAISDMIATEHSVRLQVRNGEVEKSSARSELAALETSLDQCWDLLRQRRARAEFDQNSDSAALRAPEVVENYWA